MKKHIFFTFLKTTLVVSIAITSIQAQETEYPWVNEFIETYNANDQDRIKTLLTKKFHKAYHNSSKYWLGVFKEFGPVDVHSVGRDTLGGRATIWVRSRNTRNFVAFVYQLAEPPGFQINRMGVIRGMIPSGMARMAPDLENVQKRIADYLNKLEQSDAFSGAVLVAKGGNVIFNQAVNMMDREQQLPAQNDTKFLIASTTKMFTAVAVAQLVEQGLLNYQDPISKYLPDYPKHIGDKVKIHHLLTHSSGIELDEINAYNKAIAKAKSMDEIYQLHLKHLSKLSNYNDFELPEEFNYTNEGFDLAGYIVEKVSGQSYYDYVAEHIFKKAGMSNTSDFQIDLKTPNLAKGYYTLPSGTRKINTRHLPARSRPAGSFYSTSMDLFRFVQSVQNGLLLKRETFDEMVSPKMTSYTNYISTSQYGYGFTLNDLTGVKSWGHAGVSRGVNAETDYYPEADITVIVLSNYDRAASVVSSYIRDILHFDVD